MVFIGKSRVFSLVQEQQYETVGQFWDEMAALYGLENLQGLGYLWQGDQFSYAIGLKHGTVPGHNVQITLPDDGWESVTGQTDRLKALYDELYRSGPLQFEIETFFQDGTCHVRYYRAGKP